MNQRNESPPQKEISSFKRQYLFTGLIFFIISVLLLLTYGSEQQRNSLPNFVRFTLNNFISTSTITTSTSTTSLLPFITTSTSVRTTVSATGTTKPTTRSRDDILCDHKFAAPYDRKSDHPCEKVRCIIVIRRGGGRLGNRMFLFASAYGLARTHHCHLYVSEVIRQELFQNFQMSTIDPKEWLSNDIINGLNDLVIYSTTCTFLPSLFQPKAFHHIEFRGYWQSYKFFDAYRDDIRRIFSAKPATVFRLAHFFTEVMKSDCPTCSPLPNGTQDGLRQAFRTIYNITWIGIHIRRFDFIHLGFVSNEAYIRHAMLHYQRRYHSTEVRFVVASDDKEYCKTLFAKEIRSRKVIVLPENFPRDVDLFALILCEHSIITGGTYGFWAAYLSGGEVIHDIRYRLECEHADYYPPWFLAVSSALKNTTAVR